MNLFVLWGCSLGVEIYAFLRRGRQPLCVDGSSRSCVLTQCMALGCVQATMAVAARRSTGQERCSSKSHLLAVNPEALEGKGERFWNRAHPTLAALDQSVEHLPVIGEATHFWHLLPNILANSTWRILFRPSIEKVFLLLILCEYLLCILEYIRLI